MRYADFLASKRLAAPAAGIELKPEYFRVAVRNLKRAEERAEAADLFQGAES